MKVKKYSLDWRSSEELLTSQVNTLNLFFKNNTIQHYCFDNEFIYLFYDSVKPTSPISIGFKSIDSFGKIPELELEVKELNIIDVFCYEDVIFFLYKS